MQKTFLFTMQTKRQTDKEKAPEGAYLNDVVPKAQMMFPCRRMMFGKAEMMLPSANGNIVGANLVFARLVVRNACLMSFFVFKAFWANTRFAPTNRAFITERDTSRAPTLVLFTQNTHILLNTLLV